jgi:glycosyltransferase involved in cell wall biosynthesis
VRTLSRLQPDLIVSTLGYINVTLLALQPLLRGVPILVREANTPSRSLPNQPFSRTIAAAYRLLYPRAAAVVCQSEWMRDELQRDYRVPRERLHLIYNPVDVEKVRTASRQPMRHPGSGVRLVAAGRLTRQKGFDRLIELLPQLDDDVHLTLLGDGVDRAALEQRVHELGLEPKVSIPGFIDEPWPWFAGADAFVLPSRWEGMPNVALEALAVGTPVIATSEAGGIAEVQARTDPGVVTLARMGGEFLDALRSVRADASKGLRPSLLPPDFYLDQASSRLQKLLEECICGR